MGEIIVTFVEDGKMWEIKIPDTGNLKPRQIVSLEYIQSIKKSYDKEKIETKWQKGPSVS